MANPQSYVLGYSFTGYQTADPSTPLPAPRLDDELTKVSQSVVSLVAAVEDVRRPDGRLANQSVGPDQLSAALTIGFTNRGNWSSAGISYAAGDGVTKGTSFYSARVANVSALGNAPDVDTTTWQFLFALTASAGVADGSITVAKLDPTAVAGFRTFLGLGSFALLSALPSGSVFTLPKIADSAANNNYVFGVADLVADRTISLPLLAADDTFVFANFIQTLTNKSLQDSTTFFIDNADPTKRLQFLLDNISTGQTRVVNMADSDVTLFPETTTAQYRANTPAKALTTDKVWAAMAAIALTPGTTVAWDLSTGIDFTLAPVQNFTLSNPTNVKVGQRGRIRIVQDATGSRTFTKSSNMKTAGGVAIVLSTAAAAIDYIDYDCVSATEIRLSVSKAWA